MAEALDECDELLTRYGGHERAGGFRLRSERLDEFKMKLQDIAKQKLEGRELIPELKIDAEVEIPQLGEELLEFLAHLEPCGEGNRAPVLMARDVTVAGKRAVGKDKIHLKLTLRQAGRSIDAIAFRKGDLEAAIPSHVDVAFHFESNEYMGIRSLQMNVLEIRGKESSN